MPLPEEIVMVETEKMLLLPLSDRLLSFSVSAVALEPLPELLSDITPAVLFSKNDKLVVDSRAQRKRKREKTTTLFEPRLDRV